MPSSTEVAQRVIHDALKVKTDEMVLITTWQHTVDLADKIALECYRAEAVPLVILSTDSLWLQMLSKISEQDIRRIPEHELSLLDKVDVSVYISGPQDPKPFRNVKGSKLAASFKTAKAISDRIRGRGIRDAEVLLGYLTPERAETYGIDFDTWKKVIEAAFLADAKQMSQQGLIIAGILEKSKEVRIKTRKGTDLKFSVAHRPVHVEDGIIDELDLENGFNHTRLPSGFIEVAPVEDSVTGTVVFDLKRPLKGELIRNLQWKFEKGKLTDWTADEGLEVFTEVLESSHGHKNRFGKLFLGINPQAKPVGFLTDELSAGCVTLAIGENRDLGGSNESDFSFDASMKESTVYCDKEPVLQDGRFVGKKV